MTRPRPSLGRTTSPLRVAPLVLAALLAGAPLSLLAQPSISIESQLAEVEQSFKDKRPADAAAVLDRVITRAQAGEGLPSGVSLERLLLAGANAHFQTQNFPRAAELAQLVEKVPSVGAQFVGEARMIQGLSLALQQKFAEAVPVFRAAEDSITFRDKALLYGAMSAEQAGQIPAAIDGYNRLLATAPRDRDWADAALVLISLHLRQGNIGDAQRGLALLRGNLALVDNLAGLNILSLQLGDALMQADNKGGALAAYRTIASRDQLVAEQGQRTRALEAQIERLKTITRGSAADLDTLRRLTARRDQAQAALEQVLKLPSYDATVRYRLAFCFQERGGPWEAALLYEDLLANFPESAERERAFYGLVRAYSDAGRFERVAQAADRFQRAYPKSEFLPQALYFAALAAGKKQDVSTQLRFLDLAVATAGTPELRESMLLMRANALFTTARYAEARTAVETYLSEFPAGKFQEEATYLQAMADLTDGRISEAEKQIEAYLQKYPQGNFVADARYRLAATAFGKQDFKLAAERALAWLETFPPEHPQRAEVLSLQGDAFAGQGMVQEAIDSYALALKMTMPDELLGYVLDELTRHYQALRQFDNAVRMWEDFASEQPDHPFVINAAYWIGRIRAREGRYEEALEGNATIARRYVTDPSRDNVERLLIEQANIIARPPRVKRGEPKPPLPPEAELFAKVNALLLDDTTRNSPTTRARILFTQAEIANLRKDEARARQLYGEIAANFAPETLPPGILGKVGDTLLAAGQLELAKKFYDQIVNAHPKSIFADYGYVGLGQVALAEGQADEALGRFRAAIDVAGARFKLKEATLGQAHAFLALGKLDSAQELFEQVAANRAWRGEPTAESLFNLGEIALLRGGPDALAKAQAHYQRVYLSYRRFAPWVARSYLRSAEAFIKAGQLQEASNTIQRMFTDRRLEIFPEWAAAQKLAPTLPPAAFPPAEAAGTPAPAAPAAPRVTPAS